MNTVELFFFSFRNKTDCLKEAANDLLDKLFLAEWHFVNEKLASFTSCDFVEPLIPCNSNWIEIELNAWITESQKFDIKSSSSVICCPPQPHEFGDQGANLPFHSTASGQFYKKNVFQSISELICLNSNLGSQHSVQSAEHVFAALVFSSQL